MQQFGGVGVFALDSQKNFESHCTSRRRSSGRNVHRRLLSQTTAGLGPVAVDEFLRSHAAFAFELNLEEPQRRIEAVIATTADEQARSLDRDFSGHQLFLMLQGLSPVNLQRLTLKNRER